MPFPISPTDGQIYEVNNNYFIYSSSISSWKRIEPNKIIRSASEPTPPLIGNVQKPNWPILWQDTLRKIIWFWNGSRWLNTNNFCQNPIVVVPSSLKFYHEEYTKLTTDVLPKTTSSQPRRPINCRDSSEYEVEINGPVNYPTVGFIEYFIQFLDEYNNPLKVNLSTQGVDDFIASWDISNNTGVTIPSLLTRTFYADPANNRWGITDANVYVVVVQYDILNFVSYFNILPSTSYSNPTPFNIKLTNPFNELSIVNHIPAAHCPFRASPTGISGYNQTRARSIPPRLNAVIYPQNTQIQEVGQRFSIPIVVEAITGYDNVYDNGDNFTGQITNVPSNGTANMTYQNYSGTISISISGLDNVYGNPTYSLGGTTTVTPVNGIAVFNDLVLNISNYGLGNNQIGVAYLSVTASDNRFRSRPIKIYWK